MYKIAILIFSCLIMNLSYAADDQMPGERTFAVFMEKKYGEGWRWRKFGDADYIAMIEDDVKENRKGTAPQSKVKKAVPADWQRLLTAAKKKPNLMLQDKTTGTNLAMIAASVNGAGFADMFDALSEEHKKQLVQHVNNKGQTVLMMAAKAGRLEAIKKILHVRDIFGITVNAQDSNGDTALMYAVNGGQAAAVKLLLDAGFDSSIKNNQGVTALERAKELGNDKVMMAFMEHEKQRIA